MKNDLKKSIENAMTKSRNTSTFDSTKLNKHQTNQISQDQISLSESDTSTQEISNPSNYDFDYRKEKDKPLKVFGGICIALFVVTMFFGSNSSVDTSEAAKKALTDKVSTSLSAGTILLAEDENIGQQDYTINHAYDKKDTKIWVWDYAAEDGDYVQVLVGGTPVAEAYMIKHKPVEITVPAVGDVQIKGIRDGGGGITYAVRYDLNGTNYFNSAPEGEFNTYTLIKE